MVDIHWQLRRQRYLHFVSKLIHMAKAKGGLFLTGILQSKYTLFQNSIFALGSPLAGVIIFFAFISSICDATRKNAVNWKDRKYTIKER
jgi:ABC-type enterochelin transport system permease subunit